MSDEGHNYTWSPPAGGWLTFDSAGKVIRDQPPGLGEFLYEGTEPDPDERVWRYLDWLMPDEDTVAELDEDYTAEMQLKARDYEGWANL